MALRKSKKRSRSADSVAESTWIRGFVRMQMCDAKTGRVIHEQNVENRLTTAGKDKIAQLIAFQPAVTTTHRISHGQIGTGTAAPAVGDSDLASPIAANRKTLTDSANFSLLSAGTARFMFSYDTNEANSTLSEIGLFNSSSSGTLFARATFNTTTKDTGMTVAFTYDLVFSGT